MGSVTVPLMPLVKQSDDQVLLANSPPFDSVTAIYTSKAEHHPYKLELHLPALYNSRDGHGRSIGLAPIQPDDGLSVQAYFSQHLSVARLNIVHKHLWLAGLPRHAQPLHNHILRKRKFVITERAEYHLLWQKDSLLLMPLPAYLLDYEIWAAYICTDQSLYELANGMLLSYIWLICSESDLALAHEAGLMPNDVTWAKWTKIVRSARRLLDGTKDVNPRYMYGELRLGRINWIYRFCNRTRNFTTIMRGYNYGYTSYGSFFERNTAWIVAATVYITVVLTAMQVGLATQELQDNASFSRISYGFTILAIVAPIGGLVAVTGFILVLIPFNLTYALGQRKRAARVAQAYSGNFQH